MSGIRPGQEYESSKPLDDTRIRVVGTPVPGPLGGRRVAIVTLTADGREIRPRMIDVRHLHPTGLTASGKPRKTGWRLVRNADGTPAVTR
jgi:hypothetical protein